MRKFLITIAFIYIAFPVFSADFVLWRNLKPAGKIEMRVIDDFEEKIKWKMSNNLGIPGRIRLVNKSPGERDLHNYNHVAVIQKFNQELGVLKDSAIIHDRNFSQDQKFAQELIVYFNNPGRDYQIIEIPEVQKKFIDGRALAFSVWVFGVKKKHVLYALFSNQARENISVRIGSLDFKGWKRMEVPVGNQVIYRNRLNDKVYQFRFDGFKIVSHPKEPRGNFLFLHDLISVLVDTDYDNYPGADIKDNWE